MVNTSGAPAPAAALPPKPAKSSEMRETLLFLVKLAIAVLIFRSFMFAPFNIPSQSMLPRLYVGDFLFISKWNYGYSRWSLPGGVPLISGRFFASDPARGDVVVFRGPPERDGSAHDVIKRVIGVPGDSVQMRQGQVILNGQAIPKQRLADFVIPLTPNYPAGIECPPEFQGQVADGPVCRYQRFRETLPGGRSYAVLDREYRADADDTAVFTVPAGHVFVMGDNRDASGDSRFAAPGQAALGQAEGMGYVPLDRVQGKALFTFWSTDGSASWLNPVSWFTATRWERIGEGF